MSIIYDALQKTQQQKSTLDKSVQLESIYRLQRKPINKLVFFFIGGLLILLMCFAVSYRKNIINLYFSLPYFTKNTRANHLHKLKLQLNGVFLSGQNKLAMINNQTYFLGDQIDGLKIVAIEDDRVRLNDDEHHISLGLVT